MNKQNNFKPISELRQEIEDFLGSHNYTLNFISNKVYQLFECSCYNCIINYFKHSGYVIRFENLKDKAFIYKISPKGNAENFSYVSAEIMYKGQITKLFIRQNMYVQSYHQKNIFLTPDIVIFQNGVHEISDSEFNRGISFSHISNEDLISFAEVKHFTPFPELIVNFTGLVNELSPRFLTKNGDGNMPNRIAPSLLLSGRGTPWTLRIKESLEERYTINIIFDMFGKSELIFSKKGVKSLKKI